MGGPAAHASDPRSLVLDSRKSSDMSLGRASLDRRSLSLVRHRETQAHAHTPTHRRTRTHAYIYKQTNTCTQMNIYMYTHTTHMHKYKYKYILNHNGEEEGGEMEIAREIRESE